MQFLFSYGLVVICCLFFSQLRESLIRREALEALVAAAKTTAELGQVLKHVSHRISRINQLVQEFSHLSHLYNIRSYVAQVCPLRIVLCLLVLLC